MGPRYTCKLKTAVGKQIVEKDAKTGTGADGVQKVESRSRQNRWLPGLLLLRKMEGGAMARAGEWIEALSNQKEQHRRRSRTQGKSEATEVPLSNLSFVNGENKK